MLREKRPPPPKPGEWSLSKMCNILLLPVLLCKEPGRPVQLI